MSTATLQGRTAPRTGLRNILIFTPLLGYALSQYALWGGAASPWVKGAASLGIPAGLLLLLGLGVVALGRLLPPLDRGVGTHLDRTIRNAEGNYETTFLKTGAESHGRYELLRVEIEPGGGNEWHYHRTFEEQFTVLTGELTVGLNGAATVLAAGTVATVRPGQLHYFRNHTGALTTIQVQVTPAAGLEKSLRVAYGLANAGQWEKDALFPRNPGHLFLLLGYSETYLPHLPGWVQEPLVDALARIAQWKGEDRDLTPFFE
jgi:quercetin dioxygenase-like cupin family protein